MNDPESNAASIESAYRLSAPAVVRELIESIGSSSASEIGGVKNTRSIYQWLNGEREPERLESLRLAVQVARVLRDAGESQPTISAWFNGVNPRLNYETPARMLSTHCVADAGGTIMAAALAFAATKVKAE